MTTFIKILISVFLIASVSFYLGHDVVDYYSHHTDNIENTAKGAGAQMLITSESFSEEEVSFYTSDHTFHIINSGSQSYSATRCFFPPKLYYSIWLPPDKS